MGWRRRNRLLDVAKLLWLLRASCVTELRLNFNVALEQAIARNQLKREPRWTESLAVGSQNFVGSVEKQLRNRQETECVEEEGLWVLREGMGEFSGPKTGP